MSVTLIIIILTCLISIAAFQNSDLMGRFVFSPYTVARNTSEWFRFVTSGFLHGSWLHLGINMYVLWIFGETVEQYFQLYFYPAGIYLFIILYMLAIPISETYSFIKHRDNFRYASLGASGAVAAVVFASIIFSPTSNLYLMFIPVGIPAFIFGPMYLAYSAYMAKQQVDNIGHDAHFWGAVFGFIFPLLFKPDLILIFFGRIAEWVQTF